MKRFVRYFFLFGSVLLLSASSACAKLIKPDDATYTYNFEENDELRLCEITLNLTNSVAPQMVSLTAFAAFSKPDGSLAAGFITSAAKRIAPGGLTAVPLSSASFQSQSFQSANEMEQLIVNDTGIMVVTLDGSAATTFLQAFIGGNFKLTLSLTRSKNVTQTFIVLQAPSQEVQKNFTKCLNQLNSNTASMESTINASSLRSTGAD